MNDRPKRKSVLPPGLRDYQLENVSNFRFAPAQTDIPPTVLEEVRPEQVAVLEPVDVEQDNSVPVAVEVVAMLQAEPNESAESELDGEPTASQQNLPRYKDIQAVTATIAECNTQMAVLLFK